MWLQQIFIASLSVCLILQHVAAVVNNGQTKKIEETVKNSSTIEGSNKTTSTVEDLVAESSEPAIRREGVNIPHTYEAPPLASDVNGHFNLPVPVYGVPSVPSNNVIYPAPPPDIPPPPSKSVPSNLYGTPTFGKTYGVPQINPLPPVSKGYNLPPVKYNFPSFSSNQFSTNLIPPKPLYGPPKNTYGPPGKPFKYPKYPSKGFGIRPTKPVYGPPLNFKDNFNYNKLNINNNNFNSNNFGGLYTNTLFSNNNKYPSLYSGISSLNHQYGAPVIPPKKAVFSKYGPPNTILSTQYDVPNKQPAYGPPQPSTNPRPPHPGAPAPPTPPDIKYDGWQPIPGLVSKKPTEEIHHSTVQDSRYHDLSPPSLNIGTNQLGNTYGAPSITLDLTQGNSLLDQPGLSNSYEVDINSVTGSKTGLSDSYSAPLGTVTGSGGIVASSGAEAHGGSAAISEPHSHSGSQSLSIDLSAPGVDHGSDIQATKSVDYEISPHGILDSNTGSTLKISDSYYAPQVSSSSFGRTYGSKQSYNGIGSFAHNSNSIQNSLHGHKNSPLFGPTKGLVPPSGVYGVPPSSQFGTSLYTNSYGNSLPPKRPVLHREPIQQGLFQNIAQESYNKDIHSFGSSPSSLYLPPPPAEPSISYGISSGSGAISFQNLVHGSSTAGIDLHQNSLNGEGASSLLLNTYNTPLDDTYKQSSSDNEVHVALDYSHPSQIIDFTQGKHSSLSHECTNNQHHQISELVAPQALTSEQSQKYGVQDLTYSSSVKSEAKVNSIGVSETHGKNYGKSVAESFGPNSELVESQSIDLNNISLQGNLGSYTLQIQSADGPGGQVPHTQVLNDGLLQSILQAIEQPGKEGQNNKYPIILQPSIERDNYSVNETITNSNESQSQASEIREVIVEAPKNNEIKEELNNQENEETLQLLDTSNIALYYKKEDDATNVKTAEQENRNQSIQ